MRLTALLIASASLLGAQERGPTVSTDLTSTWQRLHPAGSQITFGGRPVVGVATRDGRRLLVKDNRGLVLIDPFGGRVLSELSMKGGTSMTGIALTPDGSRVLVTGAGSTISVITFAADKLALARTIELPKPKIGGEAYPCGISLSPNGRAWVCLSRSNEIAEIDLSVGKVLRQIEVDVAPFDIKVSSSGTTAVVSCWAKRQRSGKKSAPSGGTEVEVDKRGIGVGGSVCLVDIPSGRVVARIPAGLQPSGIAVTRDGVAFAANANSDSVTVIDLAKRAKVRDIVVRPDNRLPFGSAPNALALSADERTLYVACGGNNAVAVLDRRGSSLATKGFIPTGWYPGGIVPVGPQIAILNIKGAGSRLDKRADGGRSVYSFLGSVSMVDSPGDSDLKAYTATVMRDVEAGNILENLRRISRQARTPVPVPARLGDPSVFEHVVYIIKENRTYDQVFGDLRQGDGDPKLVMYGREVTPNHHALAEQFALLDNYYCNGVNSADGHAWAVEGNASSYLERSFGGFARSYPFGDDPLTPSSSGFLWDNVLGHGLSFRNYGEFDYATPVPKGTWIEVYWDNQAKRGKFSFKPNIGVERLRGYSCPGYPGWNMGIPDQVRADVFLKDFAAIEKRGRFANLTIIYLPQDHTSGTSPGVPTPRAHVADNDLALGRIVEAITKSRFWPKTCIFVNEDDPQDGFDHVDGHRSLCLVVSPYTKRGAVVSNFYNQTSVLVTLQRMLGIPPMNQMDGRAPLMRACFQAKADLRPFAHVPNRVPLDELNPSVGKLSLSAAKWAKASQRLDLSVPDRINDDLMNRILWHAAKGARPYPSALAGAHGKGLRKRGLRLERGRDDD
jgi:DNA-binding beta-propeller fold protein YncE